MHINVINEAMGVRKSETENIYVGMAGTRFVGSDSYAMVVTEVISPKKIRVADLRDEDYECNLQADDNGNQFLPAGYMSKYTYVDTDKKKILVDGEIYTYRKNKRWLKQGAGLWETGGLHLGKAEYYRDPSF